jgi:hypothetical protein
MDLYHLRQRLHVIASSWDYRGGAESRVSVRGNSDRFKDNPYTRHMAKRAILNKKNCTNQLKYVVLKHHYLV